MPQDYTEAAKWYRLAAEQGNAVAQLAIGVMYDSGKGVPQDSAEAVKWYRLAAEQGDPMAQQGLGLMYDIGEGVPQDFVTAHMWFSIAAANGIRESGEERYLPRFSVPLLLRPQYYLLITLPNSFSIVVCESCAVMQYISHTFCEHHYIVWLDGDRPVVVAILHERMDFVRRLKDRL